MNGVVGGIVRFKLPDPTGLATPIESDAPGFVGRGLTSGGLPEFVVQNVPVQSLPYTLELIQSSEAVLMR